jgi:cytochrome P450
MWILLAIVLFTLVFLGLRKRYARFSQFKGISPLQFFFLKNVHYRITALRKEKLVCLHTPAFSFVLATHPDSAKFILSDAESFPKQPRTLNARNYLLFSKNILLTNGDQWRRYRNVLSPPFHFDTVKQWIPHFHQLTLELMQHWTPLVTNKESIDIVRWMPLFTLDVLGTTVLSRSFNAMKGQEDKELAALAVLLQSAVRPSTMILGLLEKITGITLLGELYSNIEILQKFLVEIVNTHKANKNKDEGKFDLIDVMLSAHDPSWDDNELVSNAFVMFVAGHETTSTALTWLFYHLATNKHVQDKVSDEVQRVLNGQPVTQDSLKELTFMNNVIKENMRVQPPVLMTGTRVAEKDIEYEGKVIPKGARVGIDIYALHHSPEFWENPEEFNPDRFDKSTVPFAYLPFSLKSRACLGNQFSLVEQAVFFATFLQHFKVDKLTAFKPITGNHPAFNQPKEVKVTLTAQN